MDIKEAYEVMQKASGIKKGCRVKVLRAPRGDKEMGWTSGHVSRMNDVIGRTYTVESVCEYGIRLVEECYTWPFFVFELISQPEPEEMVDIDGKSWSLSTVKEALRKHAD